MRGRRFYIDFTGLPALLVLAVVLLLAWWFFSALLSVTLGQLLIYAVIGLVCFAAGRASR